mmetsp:Transcript_14405/g.32067  ORF Transcript_14405/g.32067 Transcript_14405/m.32067 type:complete len:98 (+) Transcript_14405:32-325(+)
MHMKADIFAAPGDFGSAVHGVLFPGHSENKALSVSRPQQERKSQMRHLASVRGTGAGHGTCAAQHPVPNLAIDPFSAFGNCGSARFFFRVCRSRAAQ